MTEEAPHWLRYWHYWVQRLGCRPQDNEPVPHEPLDGIGPWPEAIRFEDMYPDCGGER